MNVIMVLPTAQAFICAEYADIVFAYGKAHGSAAVATRPSNSKEQTLVHKGEFAPQVLKKTCSSRWQTSHPLVQRNRALTTGVFGQLFTNNNYTPTTHKKCRLWVWQAFLHRSSFVNGSSHMLAKIPALAGRFSSAIKLPS
ncbi:hypothetical protein PR048_026663 [Dryococelus australis]|uniref:Uncharacterized protein n=1 Tax=Dryococelus australis TaxID=614101 RepID=A0ABQ9GLZ2_9NEOP|nr:hypothetical protein PR048_026663 [Dryococelus australis]